MQVYLSPDDSAEVRRRTLVWIANSTATYEDLAVLAGLKRHQVADFLCGKTSSLTVVACLVDALPLGLAYEPPRVLPR